MGSFDWLKDIFVAEQLLRPKARILHYPIPIPPERKHLVICITNYTGRAREDIRKMITALGATYTAQLSANNTHLIAAVPSGPKYMRAVEWNIATVNHLWVEESFVQWKMQAITKPAYNTFPPGVANAVGDSEVPQEVTQRFLDMHDQGRSSLHSEPYSGFVQGTQSHSQAAGYARSASQKLAGSQHAARQASIPATNGDDAMYVDVPVVHVSLPGSGRPSSPQKGTAGGMAGASQIDDSQVHMPGGLQRHPKIVRGSEQDGRRTSQGGADGILVPSSMRAPAVKVESQPASPTEVHTGAAVGTPKESIGSPLALAVTGPGSVSGASRKRRASSDVESEGRRRKSRGSPEPLTENSRERNVTPGTAGRRNKPVVIAFTGYKPTEKHMKVGCFLDFECADLTESNRFRRTSSALAALEQTKLTKQRT